MIPVKLSSQRYKMELKEQISSIEAEKLKNPEQYRKKKPKLANLYNDLGGVYQQEGNAESAKYCFARASNLRTMR